MKIPFLLAPQRPLALLLTLFAWVSRLTAQDTGLPGAAVAATVGRPDSAGTGAIHSLNHFQVPLGFQVSLQHHEDLKHRLPGPIPAGGTQINNDPNTGTPSSGGSGFNGPTPNGWIPYDAAVAVGPNHVLVMANAQWLVYSKTGTVLKGRTDFATWWGTTSGTPFDPKCFFESGHYVILATSVGNGLANMYVSISQTDDPTGAWWNYTYDWRLDGTTPTTNWGDFPGLGYDNNSIYINANQYSISGNAFQYSKVRVLSKAQLYSGSASTYTDFINLKNADGSSAFTPKPARCLTSSTSGYLLNTYAGGGSVVTLWRIDNGPATPVLTRVGAVSVGTYGMPPDAPQLGTATLVPTGDCRTQDIVWQSGLVHTAFSETYNGVSSIRYLKINAATAAKVDDITYTATGVHMYYPAATVDGAGNMLMTYSRSSASEYISMYWAAKGASDATIGVSTVAKPGSAVLTASRWGDYSGIANDGPSTIWAYGGYAGGNSWNSWISSAVFSAPPPTLPSAPPTLSATGANLQINLTWGAASGATSYSVYRGTSPGAETLLVSGITTSNYTDTSVNNGTLYYYVVTGVNSVGEGPASPEASATPTVPIPGQPTSLTATGDDRQIKLTWGAASSAASYRIYRGSATGTETLFVTGVTTTSYTDAGLVNGTTFFYKVTGVNTANVEGPVSNEASATANVLPPTSLSGNTRSSGTSNLSWTQSKSAAITSNKVYRRNTGTTSWTLRTTLSPAATSYKDTGTSRTTYDYYVTAVTAGGESPASNVISIRMK